LATVVVTNHYTRTHDLRGAALVREVFDRPRPLTALVLGEVLAARAGGGTAG
jgi:hypothetical protein